MKAIAEKLTKIAKNMDEEFDPDTVLQTKDEYILITETVGVPPVIINKKTMEARYAIIGDEKDMNAVFTESTFVERVK